MKIGNSGFSLIAVIMAAGAVSGLSLVLTNLNKQQLTIQYKVKTHFEISNISNSILRILFDSRACTYTLGGSGSAISNGSPIPAIKNRQGSNTLTVNKTYGNNTFKIESITLANTNLTPATSNGSTDLQVTFKKTSQAIRGYNKVVKTYPLSLDLDTASRMISCHSSHEGVIFSVGSNSCTHVDGTLDPATGKCIPGALRVASKKFCEGIDAVHVDPQCNMDSLIQKIVRTACKGMDGTYEPSFKRCKLPPAPSP